MIVDGLKDAAREHLETINDYETLGEMLTFIYDETGNHRRKRALTTIW